jgi:hypothetical protein
VSVSVEKKIECGGSLELIPYRETPKALLDAIKEVGLEVNPEKTKYML